MNNSGPMPNPVRPGPNADASVEAPVEPLDPIMLAEVLEALAERLASLEELVQTITSQMVQAPAGGPWAWRHLPPSQTRALFTELRDWVDWITTRYQLRGEAETIPPCWFRHPVAVEELTGLMVAWKDAYSQKAAAPSDAIVNWHDRWLWPTLGRLNIQLRVWVKCTGGTHTPPRPAPPITDDAAFNSFLAQPGPQIDTAGHPDGALDTTIVQAILASGEAIALLPDDPCSPLRYRGRWFALTDETAGEIWRHVDDERSAQLDLLASRHTLTGRPGSSSP